MKIVTWNCNGSFRTKYHLLDDLGADIAVVQECEDPQKIGGEYLQWSGNYLWVGGASSKGLGVFVRTKDAAFTLKQLDWDSKGCQLFLPCTIGNRINLLAVWTKKSERQDVSYIGQLWQYLQAHKENIKSAPTVICGDFNSNTCWDKKRQWNHTEVVRALREIHLESLYHKKTDEKQGEEKTPTFFQYRKRDKPYHIDYAFLSESLMKEGLMLDVGKPDFWLNYSDHMPVIFSVYDL